MRSRHTAPQQGGCHRVLEHLLILGNKVNFIKKTRKEGGALCHVAPQQGGCHCVLEHLLLLGNNKTILLKNKGGRR